MIIYRVNNFAKTLAGRIGALVLSFAIFNLTSCTVYKSAETNLEYVRQSEQIAANLEVYKFYVFDSFGSYLLENPVFNVDGSISGNLSPVQYDKPDSTWSKNERKEYWANHKYDIGIYTNTTVSDLHADVSGDLTEVSVTGGAITIDTGDIEKMTITSIDKEGELGAAALIVLIVLGIILVIGLLIILITVTAEASADGSESSSDGSSDGGSTSESGGSGSGSSG